MYRLFPCPQCGAWTPVGWGGDDGLCTSCFLTLRVLLTRFDMLTHSHWFRWHGWLRSLRQTRQGCLPTKPPARPRIDLGS